MQKYFTPQGLEKLKKELEILKSKRKEIAEKIADAKDLGDLSENAEYQAAKDWQGMNETRILELESILKQAVVVRKEGTSDRVQVGSRVKVRNDSGEKMFYIVGSNEADPSKGYISNESPLGKKLMGSRRGDRVVVEVPRGEVTYEIIEVE